LIEGEAEILVRANHIDKVVRNQGPLLHRRLGSSDVHVTVDLPAVGVDDLTSEGLAKIER
jgi:hypothetical protein